MLKFIEDYFIWHYSKGIKDLFQNIKNFFWFNNHLFSYKFLFKNLFSPFMRIKEKKLDIFSVDSVFSFVIINILMRFIGLVSRLVLIIIGISILALTVIFSIIILFIWVTFPIFIIALIADSLILIFK